MTMLVLSRKKNESIVINDSISIVVVEIRGDKVRLGVEAPKDVAVHRKEVYDAIKNFDLKVDFTGENNQENAAGPF
jgi:carbon storage regulator